ncbi:uncharacterized protein TNCV_3456441 [Trichonephila clavipes]|nr:uncharacterized protein TNCV_3456441 [Trichonephila clavipes]
MKNGRSIIIDADVMCKLRKCDETEIGTGSSDNGSLRDESSGFDRVQRRSNESRDGKKKGSEVKRELEEKGLSFKNDQTDVRPISANHLSDQNLALGLRQVERFKKKDRPNKRNSNAHHKRLQPQTTKWKKSGIPTNHGDENRTRRTSSSQEKQMKELQPYIEVQTRSDNKNTRRRGNQQKKDQERKRSEY